MPPKGKLLIIGGAEDKKGVPLSSPIANPFGFIQYRREANYKDLNRSFPGSTKGSLASRLAFFYTQEIIKRCDFGIDLYSGGRHLLNTPPSQSGQGFS